MKGFKFAIYNLIKVGMLMTCPICFVFAEEAADDTLELPAKTDDLEVIDFKNQMEDRLSRDVAAYLGHNRFIINVDAELKKTRTVQTQPQSKPVAQPDFDREQIPDPTLLNVQGNNQQPEINDVDLPGLPINDVTIVGDNDELRRMRDEVRMLQLEAEQAKKLAAQQQQRPPTQTTLGFHNSIERLIINLVVDSKISEQQEAFLRNLIFQKANLNEVRGDELKIVRTEFINGLNEEGEVVEDDAAVAEPWYRDYFEPILFGFLALLLLLLLWLIWALLRKKPEDDADKLKNLFPAEQPMKDINPPPSLAAPVDQGETIDLQQAISTLRQEVISLGLGQPQVMQEFMDELMLQGDKARIPTSMYKILGRNLFKSLFPTIPEEKLNDITIYLAENDMEEEALHQDIDDFHQEVMKVINQGFSSDLQPFRFLEKLNDSQIIYLLRDEEPRIKALVISQLPPDRAAELLKRIPIEQQGTVITELGGFEHFPVDTFREVANRLAKRSLKVPSFENLATDGTQVLMRTLDNMSTSEAEKIMNQLKVDNPDTYYRLREVYYTFPDLEFTPREVVSNVLREVERKSIAAALLKMSDTFQGYVLASLPPKLKIAVKEELKFAEGAFSSEYIDNARLTIANKVRDLIKAGRFHMDQLERPDSDSTEQAQAS